MTDDINIFVTKADFSKEVIELVEERGLTYIETVVHMCEERGIEPEDAGRYLTPLVKSRIEDEAQKLNILPKEDKLRFD